MRTTNFFVLFCSFMLLFFAVFGQKTSGEKFGINIQRKLQRENYIIVKYQNDFTFSGVSRGGIKNIKCGDDGEEISGKNEFSIAAFTLMYVHFSEPLESMKDFFRMSGIKNQYIQ